MCRSGVKIHLDACMHASFCNSVLPLCMQVDMAATDMPFSCTVFCCKRQIRPVEIAATPTMMTCGRPPLALQASCHQNCHAPSACRKWRPSLRRASALWALCTWQTLSLRKAAPKLGKILRGFQQPPSLATRMRVASLTALRRAVASANMFVRSGSPETACCLQLCMTWMH